MERDSGEVDEGHKYPSERKRISLKTKLGVETA